MMKRYIKSLASKLIIKIKRIPSKIKEILKMIFAIIGCLVTIEELAEIINIKGVGDLYKEHWVLGLFAIIIVSILYNMDKLEMKVVIAGSSDVTITLKVCDALKNKGAVIIPTNTTFDTLIKDDFISEGSIQGQYQLKYFREQIPELDKILEDELRNKKHILLNDRHETKIKRYPIGTVCRISKKNKRAYFLADSDINAKGIPYNVDITSIAQSLDGLWASLAEIGNHEPYSIPLLGTGKARAKDASRDEVVRTIILSFLASVKEHKVTESLIICIHTNDYEKIHWDDLCEFLNYHSRYTNLKPISAVPDGAAEITPAIVELKNERPEDETKYESDLMQIKEYELSEKEKIMISLLKGNEMKMSEIAAAMGLSIHKTLYLLNKLTSLGVVKCKGTNIGKVYYVSK